MKCQHTGCGCDDATIERDGRSFCSEHCAEAATGGHGADGCNCEHAGCGSKGSKS